VGAAAEGHGHLGRVVGRLELGELGLGPALSRPTFTAFRSLPTEMPWPFRLRRARMYIGRGLPPVAWPVVSR